MCEMRAMTLTSQGYCENSIRKALSSALVSSLTTYTAFKVEALVLSLLLYLETLGEKNRRNMHIQFENSVTLGNLRNLYGLCLKLVCLLRKAERYLRIHRTLQIKV